MDMFLENAPEQPKPKPKPGPDPSANNGAWGDVSSAWGDVRQVRKVAIVSEKDKTIAKLREENEALRRRCTFLEGRVCGMESALRNSGPDPRFLPRGPSFNPPRWQGPPQGGPMRFPDGPFQPPQGGPMQFPDGPFQRPARSEGFVPVSPRGGCDGAQPPRAISATPQPEELEDGEVSDE